MWTSLLARADQLIKCPPCDVRVWHFCDRARCLSWVRDGPNSDICAGRTLVPAVAIARFNKRARFLPPEFSGSASPRPACAGLVRVAASTILVTHTRARGAGRRFQIAVSFFSFRTATESTAPRSDGAGRADRAGGGARRRATPWPAEGRPRLRAAVRPRDRSAVRGVGCGVLSLSDFRLARSQSLSLGVAGSRTYSRWRAGSCPSLRPRRRQFLFAVMGWWPALLVCAIDGGAGGELPGHGDRRPRDRSAVRAIRYPACVRSQISGWRDRGLYPLARVAAEESGAGLGWRRRWWGDGAMAAPALSCRVGRERELDRSCAGGLSGVCSLSNFRLARSRSLSLGAGGSRGIGAGLEWRRRCWWGDGAMAAPALSCRVGRERELDRSCAGGVRCWREQAHVGLNRPRPMLARRGWSRAKSRWSRAKSRSFPPSICPNVFGLNCLIGIS